MNKLTLAALLLLQLAAPADNADLTVVANGFASDKGFARFSVFTQAAGFPSDPVKAVAARSVRIIGGRAKVTFSGLPTGEYAVSVLHDENRNGKMDTTWMGAPKEGFGSSNNVRSGRRPDFKQALFTLPATGAKLEIVVRYYQSPLGEGKGEGAR